MQIDKKRAIIREQWGWPGNPLLLYTKIIFLYSGRMEKTKVKKPGKAYRSPASRWGRVCEAPFITVLGIPGAVFLFVGEKPQERYVGEGLDPPFIQWYHGIIL